MHIRVNDNSLTMLTQHSLGQVAMTRDPSTRGA